MTLAGKTALVTGAGRGIGKGCALELARAGADVVLNDRPGSKDLAATAEEVRALGRKCHLVEADVFSRSGCQSLVAEALHAAGSIDILISNPARGLRCNMLDYSADDFEMVVQATLFSAFYVGQAVARHQVERGAGGKLVFISSVMAEMPFALNVAYGAAKAGVNHMARTMAVELSEHRINVNVIEPGWTDTPGEREVFADDVIRTEGGKLPWGRLGTIADIGHAAVFLSSSAADYITGTTLPVDGGFRYKDCRAAELTPTKKS